MKSLPNHSGSARRLRVAVAAVSLAAALLLLGGSARAQNYTAMTWVPNRAYGLRGFSYSNGTYLALEPSAMFFFGPIAPPIAVAGDWVVADKLGVLLLGAPTQQRMTTLVWRGEVGIAGSGVGIGLATNAIEGNGYSLDGGCDVSEFLGSGILSLEARVERTYGFTTWHDTTYLGWQLSLAGIIWKPAVGWMVAADDPGDRHWQITLIGGGW